MNRNGNNTGKDYGRLVEELMGDMGPAASGLNLFPSNNIPVVCDDGRIGVIGNHPLVKALVPKGYITLFNIVSEKLRKERSSK